MSVPRGRFTATDVQRALQWLKNMRPSEFTKTQIMVSCYNPATRYLDDVSEKTIGEAGDRTTPQLQLLLKEVTASQVSRVTELQPGEPMALWMGITRHLNGEPIPAESEK